MDVVHSQARRARQRLVRRIERGDKRARAIGHMKCRLNWANAVAPPLSSPRPRWSTPTPPGVKTSAPLPPLTPKQPSTTWSV